MADLHLDSATSLFGAPSCRSVPLSELLESGLLGSESAPPDPRERGACWGEAAALNVFHPDPPSRCPCCSFITSPPLDPSVANYIECHAFSWFFYDHHHYWDNDPHPRSFPIHCPLRQH